MSFLNTLLRTNTPGRWVDEHVVRPGRFGRTEIEMQGYPPMPVRGHIVHNSEASLLNLATFLRTNFPDDKELENAFRVLRKGGDSLSGNYDKSSVVFYDSASPNNRSILSQERVKNENKGLIEANHYYIDICEKDDPANSRRVVMEAAAHSRAGESRSDWYSMNIPADLKPAGKLPLIAGETPGASTSAQPLKQAPGSGGSPPVIEKFDSSIRDAESNQGGWVPYHNGDNKVGWVMAAGETSGHFEYYLKSSSPGDFYVPDEETSVTAGKNKVEPRDDPFDLNAPDVERFRVKDRSIGEGSKWLLMKASAQNEARLRKVTVKPDQRSVTAYSREGLSSASRASSVVNLSL